MKFFHTVHSTRVFFFTIQLDMLLTAAALNSMNERHFSSRTTRVAREEKGEAARHYRNFAAIWFEIVVHSLVLSLWELRSYVTSSWQVALEREWGEKTSRIKSCRIVLWHFECWSLNEHKCRGAEVNANKIFVLITNSCTTGKRNKHQTKFHAESRNSLRLLRYFPSWIRNVVELEPFSTGILEWSFACSRAFLQKILLSMRCIGNFIWKFSALQRQGKSWWKEKYSPMFNNSQYRLTFFIPPSLPLSREVNANGLLHNPS